MLEKERYPVGYKRKNLPEAIEIDNGKVLGQCSGVFLLKVENLIPIGDDINANQ